MSPRGYGPDLLYFSTSIPDNTDPSRCRQAIKKVDVLQNEKYSVLFRLLLDVGDSVYIKIKWQWFGTSSGRGQLIWFWGRFEGKVFRGRL